MLAICADECSLLRVVIRSQCDACIRLTFPLCQADVVLARADESWKKKSESSNSKKDIRDSANLQHFQAQVRILHRC